MIPIGLSSIFDISFFTGENLQYYSGHFIGVFLISEFCNTLTVSVEILFSDASGRMIKIQKLFVMSFSLRHLSDCYIKFWCQCMSARMHPLNLHKFSVFGYMIKSWMKDLIQIFRISSGTGSNSFVGF